MADLSKSGIATASDILATHITNLYDALIGATVYDNLVMMQVISGVFKLLGTYDADFVFGSPQLDDDGNEDHDARMFFDKSKGAFRVGVCPDDSWDEDNIGEFSIALGQGAKASETGSVAIGVGARATATYAVAIGYLSHANGSTGIALGSGAEVTGQNGAMALGYGSVATGDSGALATGHKSLAWKDSSHAHACGYFATNGDCQSVKLQLRGLTENATPVELTSPVRFSLLDEYSYACTVTIHGRQDTGANHAMYKRMVIIERTGGTVAIVGSVQEIGTDIESDGDWDVALTEDDTNKSLCVTVTGKADTKIRWTALIEAIELGYSN